MYYERREIYCERSMPSSQLCRHDEHVVVRSAPIILLESHEIQLKQVRINSLVEKEGVANNRQRDDCSQTYIDTLTADILRKESLIRVILSVALRLRHLYVQFRIERFYDERIFGEIFKCNHVINVSCICDIDRCHILRYRVLIMLYVYYLVTRRFCEICSRQSVKQFQRCKIFVVRVLYGKEMQSV